MVDTVIEGFDADAVADQPEFSFLRVPQRDREHAPKLLEAFDAPLLKGMEDDLCIRVIGLPPMSSNFLELSTDFCVVIDLSVERDPKGTILITHRLSGSRRQIDDREAPVPQADAAVVRNPSAGSVRSAVDHRISHAD